MSDEQFDGILLGMAQQLTAQRGGGIKDLLDVFFSFLRRKTDFYTGSMDDQAEKMVMDLFKRHQTLATAAFEKEKKEQQKREEERRKYQANQQQSSGIEVLDEDEDEEQERKVREKREKERREREAKLERDRRVREEEEEERSKKLRENPESSEPEVSKGMIPNSGNGGDHETFSWTQTLQELEVRVGLEKPTKSKLCNVEIKRDRLVVGAKGQTPILDGKLPAQIKEEDSFWTLEDGDTIVVHLAKVKDMEWWKSVLEGGEEIDLQKVCPENSKLSDLDGETRQTVEKMMHNQRQKALGLPTVEEQEKQDILKKFMAQHPEMDFSKAKIC